MKTWCWTKISAVQMDTSTNSLSMLGMTPIYIVLIPFPYIKIMLGMHANGSLATLAGLNAHSTQFTWCWHLYNGFFFHVTQIPVPSVIHPHVSICCVASMLPFQFTFLPCMCFTIFRDVLISGNWDFNLQYNTKMSHIIKPETYIKNGRLHVIKVVISNNMG